MQPQMIKELIEANIEGAFADVQGDDGRHFSAIVVADCFRDKSMLDRQRQVYAALNDKLESGELHALSLKTFTKDEWNAKGAKL